MGVLYTGKISYSNSEPKVKDKALVPINRLTNECIFNTF